MQKWMYITILWSNTRQLNVTSHGDEEEQNVQFKLLVTIAMGTTWQNPPRILRLFLKLLHTKFHDGWRLLMCQSLHTLYKHNAESVSLPTPIFEMPQKENPKPPLTLECNFGVEFSEGTWDSPGVWFLIFVVQRLNLLLLLLLAELGGVRELEELGGKLHQPLWVDGRHFPHVLLGRQNQLVVHHPAHSPFAFRKMLLLLKKKLTLCGWHFHTKKRSNVHRKKKNQNYPHLCTRKNFFLFCYILNEPWLASCITPLYTRREIRMVWNSLKSRVAMSPFSHTYVVKGDKQVFVV